MSTQLTRLVLDWDGTITERDTLHMAIEEFGDVELFHALEEQIGRELTLNEVIGVEMGTISAPFDAVLDWLLDTVAVRPGLPELVAAHDPLIISAGFHELIEPVLAREGVAATVVANRIEADPTGWRSTFLEREACEVCGEPCKRVALARTAPYVYVGDGISSAGILTANGTPGADGGYLITDIQGLRNGVDISGLLPVGALGSNDNLIFANAPFVDVPGFSYTAGGSGYNVANAALGCGSANQYTEAPTGICPGSSISFNATKLSVPEPGTPALLGVGLIALGWSLRRKANRA